MPTIDIDEQLKNQLKALKNIVAAKTYNEVVNLLIRQYDAKSYYEPMLTLVLDRLDTIEHEINVISNCVLGNKDENEDSLKG
jgi:hypothetical protein